MINPITSLKAATKVAPKIISDNLPTILSGGGVVGVGLTAFLTGKEVLAAKELIDNTENWTELPKKTKAKHLIKIFWPAVLAGLGTAACIIFANRISFGRLAKMSALALTAEQALAENRAAIEDVYGEEGLVKVGESINSKKAEVIHIDDKDVYATGHGDQIYIDQFLTGKKWSCSPEWLHKSINDYNAQLLIYDGEGDLPWVANAGGSASWNDWLRRAMPNIPEDDLPGKGNDYGFNVAVNGRILELIETPYIDEVTGKSVISLYPKYMPIDNYDTVS